jgi:prepilin-type N-terminal cleavage/methylation domain-containing protein
MRVLITRLRGQDGMSLPELMVTLVIVSIVSLATFSLIDVTMRRSGEITARVDTVQRGRTAMEAMTRQLRSQICLGFSPARAVTAATDSSVTFYAYMGDPSTKSTAVSATATPTPIIAERRTLSLESGAIVERRWIGTLAPTVPLGYTFATQPNATRELLKPVQLVRLDNADVPVFRYYAYDPTTGEPSVRLIPPTTAGLSDAQLRQLALVRISYQAMPTIARRDGRAVAVFNNDVTSRTIDPNADSNKLIPCQY